MSDTHTAPPIPDHLPTYLTAQQLADRLGLRRTRVYELTRAGVIPAVRIGERTVRYDPQAVRRALAAAGEAAS